KNKYTVKEPATADGGSASKPHANSRQPRTSYVSCSERRAVVPSWGAARIVCAASSHRESPELLSRCAAHPRAALPKLPPRRGHRPDALRNVRRDAAIRQRHPPRHAAEIHAPVVR